ncbi:GNAT family N-acetyltransferase [Thalassotalea euphylliae]|uniref:N-acetyltransferase n=1 Tax=Thalassotalea euphylliae TaxID=1655234 RepID=A0A3E0UD51_9GAMM|nr:GNAT family protein [Thalassotalea euphylliae]REL34809.1 N-acetyltransferase [Thalassotalea euphylliae]
MTNKQLIKLSSPAVPDIYLQEISIDDASQTYVDWLNDPKVNQYLETRFYHQDLAAVIDFINGIMANPNEHLFTIRLAANDRHIGNIKVGGIKPVHLIGDVSLFIGEKSCWGKGYAQQAIELISRYGFESLKLRKLCAGAYKPNIGSTKAFLKAGYQKDGILKDHYLLDGKPCDLVQVGLFEESLSLLPMLN